MTFPACNLPEFLQIPVTQQKKLIIIIISIIIISSSNPTKSQSLTASPSEDDISNSPDSDSTSFQPSLAVVIGVLAVMFSLTFLLLVYAKWCHRPSSPQYLNQETLGGLTRSVSRVSGIDKTVIESLPFFRFSTLKGWRNGLECSICLSRFEDVEVLRLLPKCKHAFHIDCVDQWLEKHSGCPLCRCKVSEEDVTLFAYSSSFRFLNNQSAAHEGSNLELFVEREGSARFGSKRSVHKMEKKNIDHEEILEDEGMLHKFNHRIVISDIEHDLMGKNRWSSLSSSDLLFLKSEMITSLSSNLFHNDQDQTNVASMSSKTCVNNKNHDHDLDLDHQVIKIKEEIKRKREFEKKIKKFPSEVPGIEFSNESKSAKVVEKRSMSEIIVHPRFLGVEESSNKEASLGEMSAKEERLKRLWLPIARRTLQWFANRDEQQQQQINTRSQV
ncbi:putative transcription factor C2H2 family [Helianthus annuus]|uniref:RING-type E3 ubiquitin transferase n=1 Tax=Helianthus annuus TaxID=4232 RepID=A0A251TRP2_HELAN|nr:E3 ubiquitin-protein ligase ATL42 [Helianthus annuus]KAF5788504.1 putative transcription factor C2H2 family [Helianthus annuus]KAJ0515545.1 putative transcription factor C2H2 family [Helianthus annuus]KAJ0531728.1 putative transcription factor C2H2 family [Helianthus annuus]KAJ0701924.1 putative transcription factor C2H2 family [Helianthus annuus]